MTIFVKEYLSGEVIKLRWAKDEGGGEKGGRQIIIKILQFFFKQSKCDP